MGHRPELGNRRWKNLKPRILLRDSYVCWMCGGKATTVDHLRPVSRGGDMWDERNLAASCRRCNEKKHATWRESSGRTINW